MSANCSRISCMPQPIARSVNTLKAFAQPTLLAQVRYLLLVGVSLRSTLLTPNLSSTASLTLLTACSPRSVSISRFGYVNDLRSGTGMASCTSLESALPDNTTPYTYAWSRYVPRATVLTGSLGHKLVCSTWST